jgi:hypothetical protein
VGARAWADHPICVTSYMRYKKYLLYSACYIVYIAVDCRECIAGEHRQSGARCQGNANRMREREYMIDDSG